MPITFSFSPLQIPQPLQPTDLHPVGKVKSSSLAYNRHETQDKWLLGRDPDRSLLSLMSMEPWAVTKKATGMEVTPAPVRVSYAAADVHGAMGCDQKSFTLVRRWHQFLSGSLPNGCLYQVSHRLGRELFTLPSYIYIATTPPPTWHVCN